jgi:redox-sensitive bicupin YhaK (pirin superfamily)
MIGAWCFVDHYGPTGAAHAMTVARHPHVGLQTVSWLFNGEIEHRDSLGSVQIINPGQLNLMTSGRGIAHSELSIEAGKELHGVQLWIALPSEAKDVSPHFEHPKVAETNLITWKKSGKQYAIQIHVMSKYANELVTIQLGSKLNGRLVYKNVGKLFLTAKGDGVITQTKAPVKGTYYRVLLNSKVIYTQIVK